MAGRTPAPMSRVGPSLALALLLPTSCESPSGPPSRVPGESGLALSVPYPVAEAERIEGAGRRALGDARFVFIGGVTETDPSDHALPQMLVTEGPVLIAHHIESVGPSTSTWQRLRRLAFGRVEPSVEAVTVPAAEVEALDLRPPTTRVWLVGPQGTCQATVGDAVIGRYRGEHEILAVGYRLEGCPQQPWAQIGIVADTIPVDFRWVPADPSVESVFPHGQSWDDPLAAVIEPPAWSHPAEPALDQVRMREIPGASPRVIQLQHAWLASPPDDPERPWCEIDVAWSRADGWYNERWLDPIPWDPDAVGPFMLGAFLNGEQVDAVIYDDRFDGLVVVPPGPLDDMDDPESWRQVFVPTGRHAEDTLAQWGIQPARGPAPVGPACMP